MNLIQYKNEVEQELHSILNYWMNNTIDEIHGGFFGKIDNQNDSLYNCAKRHVLNARILWAFSAAYNLNKTEKYLSTATRAFEYIRDILLIKNMAVFIGQWILKAICSIQKNKYMRLHFAYMA